VVAFQLFDRLGGQLQLIQPCELGPQEVDLVGREARLGRHPPLLGRPLAPPPEGLAIRR
jgi:hypothetical protein